MNRTKYPKANYKRKYNNAKYQRKYRKRKALKGEKISCSSERLTYMVNNQLPIPPRYRTKVTTMVYGRIEPADLAITGANRAYVNMNSIYLPFNNGTWGAGGTGPFTLNSGLPSTIQPAGTSMLSRFQMYQAFRVYSSKIELSIVPETASDYIEATITPSENTNSPGNVGAALAVPYTKHLLFATGKGKSKLTNYMSVHKMRGVSKTALANDLSGQFEGAYNANPASRQYWIINLGQNNGDGTSLDIAFDLKITYWVEFFSLAIEEFPLT